jgi:endonuclease/exonuclease/phosphatase family metal-dependent hydrolase
VILLVVEYSNLVIFNLYNQAGSRSSPGQELKWIHYSRCRYDILETIYDMIKDSYAEKNSIICGDFNLTCKHLIYIPLLKSFNSPLCGQGTSLKRDGTVSENNYDHFLVDKTYKIVESKVFIYPYKGNRNTLSDHLPILIKLN